MTAARAEFARRGLKGARIEDITAACGLSKGAFYLHFESKEALFGEVVTSFEARLNEVNERRIATAEALIREHGVPSPHDRMEGSERYQRFSSLDTTFDLEALELMWANRDLMSVLVSGSQGTPFESLLWRVTDQQVARVARDFRRMQEVGAADREMDADLFGSIIVGAYLLLTQQMVRLEEKPDLAAWARTLHRLCDHGTLPQADAEPVPAPRATRPPNPSQRRPSARAKPRHTSRKRS
ncbi:TetR/AcrR family transcriptional regulator [Myxococcus sp. K15C18031901]|uniref:TetR/AcrR family transcriptional regulator n=1 Tax=Myxococcus dinghuensis TaxID=2906761 RepID=UPI0020A6F7B1|nr:TetR/AcrR family transcriptional regulator [Myxococcus dinghuensis]MCP3100970.1 TetR/AcrR family transcriptional regulator [Myxococcus dinghuensis]